MYGARLWSVAPCAGPESALPRLRARAGAAAPLWRAIGYRRLERPVAAVERSRQGTAVRLPDVRPVRAQLDRHVLPDELPEELRNGPAAGCAPTVTARSIPKCAASGCEAFAGAERIPGGVDAIRVVQHPVDRRLQGRSSWLQRGARAHRAGRARDTAMRFEDEPVPGYPLPILPGHISPGRFERVLRAGRVRRHDRTGAAGLRRPAGRLSARARARRLRRRDQRDRRLWRQLPHVEPGGVRAADARRVTPR